uniref:Uncharacterized protein n=1 Tax=Cannabis sativa TaxID=3483 RepID=A0A803R4D9_CANSA
MYGYTGVHSKAEEVDLESGETLYPGLSAGENQLRWGFIRKYCGHYMSTSKNILRTSSSLDFVLCHSV